MFDNPVFIEAGFFASVVRQQTIGAERTTHPFTIKGDQLWIFVAS